MDPRFKTSYIKSIDLECTKQILADEASDIEEQRIPTAASEPSTSDPPPAKNKRNLGFMFKADKYQDQERPLLSVEQRIIAELNCFEKALLLDTEEDSAIVVEVPVTQLSYPILSKFSKKISGCLCNKCCL